MPRARKVTDETAVTKRSPLNLKTDARLRTRIEAAAAESGLSLTQEVERRLIGSFDVEDRLGDQRLLTLYGMMTWAIRSVETRFGESWHKDFDTFNAAVGAVEAAMNTLKPPFPREWETALGAINDQLSAESEEYLRTADALIKRFPVRQRMNPLMALSAFGDGWINAADPRFDHEMSDEELETVVAELGADDAKIVRRHQINLRRVSFLRRERDAITQRLAEQADRAKLRGRVATEDAHEYFQAHAARIEAASAKGA